MLKIALSPSPLINLPSIIFISFTKQGIIVLTEMQIKEERQKMKRKRRIILVILLSIIIIFISLGIYYNNAYRRLELSLVGVGLGSVTYTSAEIRLIIEVQNPNVLPIYVPSGDFDVYINGQHFCDGNFGSFTVAGNSHTRITVLVAFYITDVPAVLYGLITGGGTVTVTLEGVVHVVLFDIPFDTTLYEAKFT